MRLLHDLTHWHYAAEKAGVGQIVLCGWRGSRSGELLFKPEIEGSGWHSIDEGKVDVEDLLACPDGHTAMAMIRASE